VYIETDAMSNVSKAMKLGPEVVDTRPEAAWNGPEAVRNGQRLGNVGLMP
jgi:hypothetical protein